MTWTAAIIVSAKRAHLVEETILPAVWEAHPDQILVSGEMYSGPGYYTYLRVPPMTQSTVDALVKRDVAALACTSDWIAYFCDDHKPAPDFGDQLRQFIAQKWLVRPRVRIPAGVAHPGKVWQVSDADDVTPLADAYDVYVPARYAGQPGEHYGERLNNGEASEYIPNVDQAIGHYCGGHAGVYRLDLIKRMPWTAGPHHREWDLLQSRRHMDAGAKYCWTDQLKVWDVEPNAQPWK